MQGGQPARKSSFYAVIDYVRHRLNFSAAATWVRGLLPTNHVGSATALSSFFKNGLAAAAARGQEARQTARPRGNGSQRQLPTIQHTRPIELSCPLLAGSTIGRLEERRLLGWNMMSARNGRLSLPITFFNNFAVASSLLRWGGGMLLRTGSHGSGVCSKVPDTMRIVAFNFTSRRLV